MVTGTQVYQEEVAPGQVSKICRGFLDRFEEGRRPKLLDQQGDGDEVHVGDAVLKTGGNKGCDGRYDRQDLINGAAGTVAHPDGHADQCITKDAQAPQPG